MKILGWVMRNKLLTAIVAVVIVAFLIMSTTGTSINDIIDGMTGGGDSASPGTLTIAITDATTGATGTHTMAIEELSPTASIFGTPNTLTTYNQDVWGIIDANVYEIQFSVLATAFKPADAPDDTALRGEVWIEGWTPNPPAGYPASNRYTRYVAQYNTSDVEFPDWGVPTVYDIANFYNSVGVVNEAGLIQDEVLIKGAQIDGSYFDITFIIKDMDTNGLTYYGVTTAELTLTVDNDGNVNVSIDDVITDIRDA